MKLKEFVLSWILKSLTNFSPSLMARSDINIFWPVHSTYRIRQILDFWQKKIPEIVTSFVNNDKVSMNMKMGNQWMSFWKWISVISFILHYYNCVHIHNELACDDLYLFSWEELLSSGLFSWGNKKVSAKPISYFYAGHIALWHISIELY